MFDIDFYMKSHELKKDIMNGRYSLKDKDFLFNEFEKMRSLNPIVYNIGTTNLCNFNCIFCPRTIRPPKVLKTMDMNVFEMIVEQLSPIEKEKVIEWENFCIKEYGVNPNDASENHFFLYIISQVLQLHLYGDPLLDKNIDSCVKLLHEKGFKTYFSCNPSNINLKKVEECFKNGLSYIKFSIESVDDERHKQLRGRKFSFKKSYEDICKLLDMKKEKDYKTTIVITMLDLNQKDQQEQYKRLRECFGGKEVYLYLKSEDTMWHRKDYHKTKSIHWQELCRQPWISMSIDPFGNAVECMESNSSQVILGNVLQQNLYDVWNGDRYTQFRKSHFDLTTDRCTKECDMNLVGDFLK